MRDAHLVYNLLEGDAYLKIASIQETMIWITVPWSLITLFFLPRGHATPLLTR